MTNSEALSRLFSLEDHVAVVTGAGQGLGRAIALGMAAHGAHIAAVDIQQDAAQSVAQAIAALGRKAVPFTCDVSDEAQVAALAEQVADEFGSIDALVNSAGIMLRHPIEDFPVQEWKRTLDVNLLGVFLCARAIGPIMLKRGKGSVINMASVAAFLGRGNDTSAYLTSKAGVVSLTRHLAVLWASRGVRVNAIAPAQIDTPLLDDLRSQPGALEERVARIPMGRLGQPHELVGPAIFLASDASSFVTGHILAVDGGLLAF